MLYSDARSHIKSGDILAWSHYGWWSWYDLKVQLVRIFTRSEYSHVGLAWVVAGRVFVLEAVEPKVRIFPLSKSKKFFWIPLNSNWNEEVETFALSKVGDSYSNLDAIKAFFSLPIHNNKWECAEYVAEVLKLAGVNLGTKLIPSKIVQRALDQGNTVTFIRNE